MKEKLRRRAVALATALACLAVMVSPASANATHTLDLTTGTLTSMGGGGLVMTATIGGSGAANCGTSFTVDVNDHSGPAGIIGVTGSYHFIMSSNHYVAVLTRHTSTAGTMGSGLINLGVTINVAIYDSATTTSDCTTFGNVRCTLRVTLTLSGTYSQTANPSIVASNTGALSTPNGTFSLVPFTTCPTPFSTFVGSTVSFTGMNHHALT
jgi:hypothetical protein